MSEHYAGVTGNHDFSWAMCRCGWASNPFRTFDEAQAVAYDHVRDALKGE